MIATTPVRSALVRPPSAIDEVTHAFEARLLSIVRKAGDLSSSSDEIELACTSWHDRHHLSSVRANVLRAIPLPPDSVVLELGSGGGAVTRHLGETFASVDAVEPDPALAAVVSARCADLRTVVVHAGWISDVTASPSYDVIVALDVLGELERRGDDLAAFVAQCRSLLTPRGVLIIGADNADGVRYLAGDAAPRLHPGTTLRAPRTTRAELKAAVSESGLTPTVLSAFPDHRSARTLFQHELLADLDPTLLTAVPTFPSPPYDGPRAASFPEAALWKAAIDAGTGPASANSLVVVASVDTIEPAGAATYWSMGRRAAFSTTNRIFVEAGDPFVQRSLTFPHAGPFESPMQIRPHTEPLLHGTPLTQLLAESDDLDDVAGVLRSWSELVERSTTDDAPLPWDLIPRNVMVLDSGELAAFDQEWVLEPTTGGDDLIRSRGSFWLAYDLLHGTGRPSWLRGSTIGEAAEVVLRLADPEARFDWHRRFVDSESTHMSYIWPTTPRHSQTTAARRERNNVSSLSNTPPPEAPHDHQASDSSSAVRDVIDSLAAANAELRAENDALRIEQRHMALVHRDHAVGLVASNEALKDRLERAHQHNRRQKAQIGRLQKQIDAIKASSSWRVGSTLVKPFATRGRKARR